MTDDFSALSEMKYSGRGITLGMTINRNPFVGYTLTGRSPSSQARKLVYDESSGSIRTDVTDPEQLAKGNPALLIYPAIIAVGQQIAVSNGVQTKLIAEKLLGLQLGYPVDVLKEAMNKPVDISGIDVTTFEPDNPNFTPRICGCIDEEYGGFYIVRKSKNTNSADVSVFHFDLKPGRAKMITTYSGGNENPLLPFIGEPLEARVESTSAKDLCESLYSAVGTKEGQNYRVSTAVMMLPSYGKTDSLVAVLNRADLGE